MEVLDFALAVRGKSPGYGWMALPITGGSELLDLLSSYVPDDCVNELLPRHRGRGRRNEWSSSQLFRTLLTPARSSNLLCRLLPEQRAWRRFAHLPNRRVLPNARQLHEFRDRLTPMLLRQINEGLVRRLLESWPKDQFGVALIDATDLPAATNTYKKRRPLLSAQSSTGWTDKEDRAEPLVCRLQEAHPAALDRSLYAVGFAHSFDDLGRTSQSWRGSFSVADLASLRPAPALAAQVGGRGYGLY